MGCAGCLVILLSLCVCGGIVRLAGLSPARNQRNVEAPPPAAAARDDGRANLADVLAHDGRGDSTYKAIVHDTEGTVGIAALALAKSRLMRPEDAYFHLLGQERAALGGDRWRVSGVLTAYDAAGKWLYVRYAAVMQHKERSWLLETCEFKEEPGGE